MLDKCEFTELIAQPALTLRIRSAAEDLPPIFDKAYAEIKRYLDVSQSQAAGPPYALYYNMDRHNLDVALGIPVATPVTGEGDIVSSQTPGGKAVGCLHTGPYNELESVYYALGQWIKDNGYEATGVAYEVYLHDPKQTPPEKLQSHIYLLIRTVEL